MQTTAPWGIYSTAELSARGVTKRKLHGLLQSGRLHRIARGRYALQDAHELAIRAVRLNGAVTCSTALALHGAWNLGDPALHVRFTYDRALPAASADLSVHRLEHRQRGFHAVDEPVLALQCAARCLSSEALLVVTESALNRQLIRLDDVGSVMAAATRQNRRALHRVQPLSQSGTETMVRLRLESAGYRVQVQRRFENIGIVDLVVNGWLIIECDSREFHTGVDRYESDKQRDLRLNAIGMRVLRLSYRQIVHEWQFTAAYLEHVLRGGPKR